MGKSQRVTLIAAGLLLLVSGVVSANGDDGNASPVVANGAVKNISGEGHIEAPTEIRDYEQTDVAALEGSDCPLGEGSMFDRAVAQREARENARPSISKVYEAYRAGRMDPQEAAQFENDVFEGRIVLARGKKLKKMPPVFVLPAGVIKAYNSHEMSDEDRAEVDRDLRDGIVALPAGATLKRPAPRTIRDYILGGGRTLATMQFLMALACIFFAVRKSTLE